VAGFDLFQEIFKYFFKLETYRDIRGLGLLRMFNSYLDYKMLTYNQEVD